MTRQDLGDGRVNLLATWGNPRVLYNTHLDVVPGELPVAIKGDRIHGRGAIDAKGQIVSQLCAIERLLAAGHGDLAWLGVSGEETDSEGARAALALKPALSGLEAIVVGEPTNLALATGQKGFVRMRLHCEGKSAHGGTPWLGENAIHALCDWIVRIRALPVPPAGELGIEVFNIGTISGGRAANVVPDHAEAELTLRQIPEGTILAGIRASKPENGRLEILLDEPWDRFAILAGFRHSPVPFGSDLPTLRALAPGAAAILAGPGDPVLAHTPLESMGIGELVQGIDLFEALGRHFLCAAPQAAPPVSGPARKES
jgi:acetylornithine deacetylase